MNVQYAHDLRIADTYLYAPNECMCTVAMYVHSMCVREYAHAFVRVHGHVHGHGHVCNHARSYPEWIAAYMLSSRLCPLPLSLSNALSYMFPETTQAFYDNVLEAFVMRHHPIRLKEALPAPLLPAVFLLGDLVLAAGFTVFCLASPLLAIVATTVVIAANYKIRPRF